MLIPIRCFTCGKVLANKWDEYQKRAQKLDEQAKNEELDEQSFPNLQPGFKGKILDELGLTKLCCRRHMLSHVDIIDII